MSIVCNKAYSLIHSKSNSLNLKHLQIHYPEMQLCLNGTSLSSGWRQVDTPTVSDPWQSKPQHGHCPSSPTEPCSGSRANSPSVCFSAEAASSRVKLILCQATALHNELQCLIELLKHSGKC